MCCCCSPALPLSRSRCVRVCWSCAPRVFVCVKDNFPQNASAISQQESDTMADGHHSCCHHVPFQIHRIRTNMFLQEWRNVAGWIANGARRGKWKSLGSIFTWLLLFTYMHIYDVTHWSTSYRIGDEKFWILLTLLVALRICYRFGWLGLLRHQICFI